MRVWAWILGAALITGLCPGTSRGDIFATGRLTNTGATVLRFSSSGQYLGRFPPAGAPGSEEFNSLTRGPDGNLYMLGNILGSGSIYRISVAGPGAYQVLYPEPWATQQLTIPVGLAFDPTGELYAGSTSISSFGIGSPSVFRYDGLNLTRVLSLPAVNGYVRDIEFDSLGNLFVGVDGQGIRRFANGSGNPTFTITTPFRHFNFGPDGKLYVATPSSGVLKFDPATGAALGSFVPAGSQGLADADDLVFGDDGVLYVNSPGAQKILRYDAFTGGPLGTLAVYGGATGITEVSSIAYVVPEPTSGPIVAGVIAIRWTTRRRRRTRIR